MRPTQPPDQAPLHATWAVRIDATSPDAVHHVSELADFPAGTVVVLDVQNSFPWSPQIDPRLVEFVVDQQRLAALHLEIQGAPTSIRRWWRALRDQAQPPDTTALETRGQRRRHLTLVAVEAQEHAR